PSHHLLNNLALGNQGASTVSNANRGSDIVDGAKMSNNPETFIGRLSDYVSAAMGQLEKGHAVEHGMSEPRQSAEAAKAGTESYVQSKFADAVAVSKTDPVYADFLRGQALHAIADSASPSHRDANGNPISWDPTGKITQSLE